MSYATKPRQGFGISIAFQTGWFAWITNVGWNGYKRDAIETTNDATAADGSGNFWKTFIPNVLNEAGELEVDVQFDPDKTPPIGAAPETITLTHPKVAAQTVAATWACSGFMVDFSFTGPKDALMTGKAKIKFSGAPTITAGS